MMSQLEALLVFSAIVSLVFAVLQRPDAKGRWRLGLKLFAAFVLSSLLIGWLMYPFPS
jgi:hypothetical protein